MDFFHSLFVSFFVCFICVCDVSPEMWHILQSFWFVWFLFVAAAAPALLCLWIFVWIYISACTPIWHWGALLITVVVSSFPVSAFYNGLFVYFHVYLCTTFVSCIFFIRFIFDNHIHFCFIQQKRQTVSIFIFILCKAKTVFIDSRPLTNFCSLNILLLLLLLVVLVLYVAVKRYWTNGLMEKEHFKRGEF